MSVDGLVSGMDTTTLISQLMQIEAQPQTLLKSKLSATQADATAYRAVNTRFDALRTAAEALTNDATWDLTKATSSSTAVTATAGAGALPGTLSFTVSQTAAAHQVVSAELTGTTPAAVTVGQVTVKDADGSHTLDLVGTGSLADAAAAINKADLGLTAAVVEVSAGKYRLQVNAKDTGAAAKFEVSTAEGTAFTAATAGRDAVLTVGSDATYTVTSPTNTFSGVMPGTTLTVSEKTTSPVTVTIASDPDAVAAKVASLVGAANGVLEAITAYTDKDKSTAVLKGDSTLRTLAGRVLDVVATAVGGSPAAAGLQLTTTGAYAFDQAKFVAKFESDPQFVEKVFAGTPAVPASGSTPASSAVAGIAGRLMELARSASDATTGSLTLLANSNDSTAKDIQVRIADWDLRLGLRKTTLTRQFTAMETALGTLQNQASWLSSQIGSLPTWSS
ncbi:flagellar filament capping protein FliD [Geodermatophilus sp. FMUSA9-8]|uniref:flagellar filament capping protein FliD n=1 Tax=Geodermatophilus sp. FMUSA9-8 TaxID=3120155 RepID=UPI00300A2D55